MLKKHLASMEGQVSGHMEAEGYCRVSNAREGDLVEKDAKSELASRKITMHPRRLTAICTIV